MRVHLDKEAKEFYAVILKGGKFIPVKQDEIWRQLRIKTKNYFTNYEDTQGFCNFLNKKSDAYKLQNKLRKDRSGTAPLYYFLEFGVLNFKLMHLYSSVDVKSTLDDKRFEENNYFSDLIEANDYVRFINVCFGLYFKNNFKYHSKYLSLKKSALKK